jgi:hypothetical protein
MYQQDCDCAQNESSGYPSLGPLDKYLQTGHLDRHSSESLVMRRLQSNYDLMTKLIKTETLFARCIQSVI